MLHNTEPFAGFMLAPVCQLPLSAIRTISPFCFYSCTPSEPLDVHAFTLSLSLYLPRQSVSFSPTDATDPPTAHSLSLSLVLPIVEMGVLNSTQKLYLCLTSAPAPLLPSHSSSRPVFECGMLLAQTAHYPAGSTAGSSQHQKQIDDCR